MEFGFWSVLPPLLTIVVALAFKNVFMALMLGIFTSCMVLAGGNLYTGVNETFYSFVHTFENNGNVIVLISLLLIGALIYMIERSGGIDGFVDIMVRKRALIKSKKAAGIFTWLMGVVVFTSGSLSCMVTGSVSRPINDAMKVPHEKAAFIVHATSTPWCVLFPLSGWLATLTGYLTAGGVAEDIAIATLIKSIGFNFYCWMAVIGTLAVILFKLDFGPMKKAELRAEQTGQLDEPGHGYGGDEASQEKIADVAPRAKNMFVPIITMIVVILGVLTITGGGNPTQGASMQALLWGCIISVMVMAVMCVAEKIWTAEQVINEVFKGMSSMLPVTCILLFGFTMGTLVKSLGTGDYLTSLFMGILTPGLLPVLTFILCMVLSFATGTSMGTMAIMSVIAIPMAMNMGVSVPLVAGAMFGGSIFGDHVSPISDTTIMSCATSGCNIIDHVKTQTPYAAVYAGVAIVLYLILGIVL